MKVIQQDQQKRWVYIICVTLCVMIGATEGCGEKDPIKIGFSGCLTGRLSDLGIAGRNSVMLAVEQINQAGGIKGRSIELIVKDDQHDPEVAVQVDRELIKEEVVAIIGHMTSAMSVATLSLINEEKMIMISPTSTSNNLSGLDDYFFRTGLPDKIQAEELAQYTIEDLGLKQMGIIYDLSNPAFTRGWYQNFRSAYEQQGGKLLEAETFTSGQGVSYLELAHRLLKLEPEGLIIVAGALDTALIAQQFRKLGSMIPFLSSGWAKTPELLQKGGAAVEGMILTQTHNEESKEKRYLRFKQQFSKRFGKDPNFAAVGSYDAAQLLFIALQHTERPEDLKEAILEQKVLQGLQGEIRIDQYGDAQRKTFLMTVKDGKFSMIR